MSEEASVYASGDSESGVAIIAECNRIKDMLLAKNAAYADSALNPVRMFSRADPLEQLRVRIDDKLSRIKAASRTEDEDVVLDLIGYLILLRIAQRRHQALPL